MYNICILVIRVITVYNADNMHRNSVHWTQQTQREYTGVTCHSENQHELTSHWLQGPSAERWTRPPTPQQHQTRITISTRKSIYIALFIVHMLSKRSDMDHTVLPANYTMPAFLS